MSAPGSRLARQMLSHLGTELWDEFVSGACESALQGGLAARVRARIVRCGGTLDGAPCAHATLVDLRAGAGTGVEISARSARRSSNCTWTTSGRCCDVPLLARGNTGGAAVSWNDELDCRGYVVLQSLWTTRTLSPFVAGMRLSAGCLGAWTAREFMCANRCCAVHFRANDSVGMTNHLTGAHPLTFIQSTALRK